MHAEQVFNDFTLDRASDSSSLPMEGFQGRPGQDMILAEGMELNIRRDIEAKNIRKINEIIKVLNLIIKETEND